MAVFKQYTGPLIALLIFVAALVLVNHEISSIRFSDVLDQIAATGVSSFAASLIAVTLSYGTLTIIDLIAFRSAGIAIPYSRLWPASFAGYAVSYTLGFSAVTGSAVRFRLLQSEGLDGSSLATALSKLFIFFWLGAGTVLALVLLLQGSELAESVGGSRYFFWCLGCCLALTVILIVGGLGLFRTPITVATLRIDPPRWKESLLAICIATFDWSAAALALYVLMPNIDISFLHFVGLFVFAQLGGALSHVPGGLGVFEALLMATLPGRAQDPHFIAALVLFRAVYYLLPLAVSGGVVAATESARIAPVLAPYGRTGVRIIASIVPTLLSLLVFASGVVLLTSGATPAYQERVEWIGALVPLPFLELSHLGASVIGVFLLGLSRGLWLRLRIAWFSTCILLVAGALFSLIKGFDYEEALVLIITWCFLFFSRRRFYRPGRYLDMLKEPWWLAACFGALAMSGWLLLFAYSETGYSNQLWWQVTLDGNVSRSLRASAAAAAVLLGFASFTLFTTRKAYSAVASEEELLKALPAISASPDTCAWLALLGDKSLLFSKSGRSFIMFGTQGKSLVALGDPVGDPAERLELIWSYRELADELGAYPVFYQVGAEELSDYVDVGLTLLKLGEEALVDLADFTLEKPARSSQRSLIRKIEKDGFVFSVISAEETAVIIDELKAISDQWLGKRSSNEKGFSLGRFVPDYITRMPCAIVKKNDSVVAFANVFASDNLVELSVDLMRYSDSAPKNVMEYLFVKLMLWGRDNKYQRFNLGMAPLSGLESHPLAPLWHKAGTALFRHGEDFYNFQGLRTYKAKFDPRWVPRYLASPGGLALPRALTHVTVLIGGGLKGIFSR